ncbi:MAG: PAS domain S-box protein [Ignavibacteriales bacterium]|nr:PAS domain S-box protein [Ignavibacteriales bacterium]
MTKFNRTYVGTIKKIPIIASLFSILVGILVLIGWKFDITVLRSISQEYIAMKANAAVSFLFVGLAFLLVTTNLNKRYSAIRTIAATLSSVVLFISIATILEYISSIDFGIDQLLFTEGVDAKATLVPGRMPWTVALNFFSISLFILLINKNNFSKYIFQTLALIPGIISAIDLSGYIFKTEHIYGMVYNQMALHGSVTFIVLVIGLLSSRPDEGIVRIVVSKSLGGITLRRLLLGAMLIPATLGWLLLEAYYGKIIDFEEMVAIFGLAGTFILVYVIWANARLLDRIDREKSIAEEKRKQSEQRYKTLLAEMGEGLLQTDLNEQIEFVNMQFCNLLGYTQDELIGKNARMFFTAEDWDKITTKTAMRIKGVADRYETQMIHRTGEKIWTSVSGSPLIDVDNNIIGSVAIVADIAEQKRAQKLNEALFKISTAAEQVADLPGLFKSVHHVISDVMPANNFYISLYDDKTDLISFPYFVDEVDTPELPRKRGRGLTEYVLRTGKSLLCDEIMTEKLDRDGEAILIGVPAPIWLGVPLIVEGKTIGVMVVQHYSDAKAYGEQELRMLEYVSDQVGRVIAHKQSELELTESERRFRNLYDNVPVGIYRTTPDGKILGANRALIAMMGCSSFKELTSIEMDKIGYEDPKRREIFKEIIEDKGLIQKFESIWRRPDGSTINVSENAIAIKAEDGKIIYYEGMVEDITERKSVEKERERLITELQQAMKEVQALSGLLPICASCKKIRDDSGYWNQLESFIEHRATVQFSHGICPDCMQKLYPQYYDRIHPSQPKTKDSDEVKKEQ